MSAKRNLTDHDPTPEFEIFEKDLPISSNYDDVRVIHYLFSMNFDFEIKVMRGSVILFVVVKDGKQCPAKIVLDACALRVTRISYLRRLESATSELEQRTHWLRTPSTGAHNPTDWFNYPPSRQLPFETSKWSITVRDWCPCCGSHKEDGSHEPRNNSSGTVIHIIRIDYDTFPSTPSLHWRPAMGFKYYSTELNHTCAVYTPGSLTNNRGLFPCQDAPAAFATWEALVIVQRPYQALLTSEETGCKITPAAQADEPEEAYYCYSTHSMPISTFAIIVGVFDTWDIVTDDEHKKNAGLIPTRFVSLSQQSQGRNAQFVPNWGAFRNYMRNVLQSAYETFGPHPYPRLDLVVMPQCFQTLGLASPYLVFLSPTNFTGDDSTKPLYYARIPHEISHAWFGLAIGAKDWNEVWLSEGFATFAEDVLYAKAKLHVATAYGSSTQELESELELKACVMLHTLKNEIGDNTSESEPQKSELKILVPENGNMSLNSKTVSNGLEPLRQFLQVPYLKGYFFLRYLCNLACGLVHFLPFLKLYVTKYHGQLVTSQDFITFYFDYFRNKLKDGGTEQCEQLYEDWLYKSELPETLKSMCVTQLVLEQNRIPGLAGAAPIDLRKCLVSFERINRAFHQSLHNGSNKIDSAIQPPLNSYELILLFEVILEKFEKADCQYIPELISASVGFTPESHNPEVLHRWCEILLKAICQSPDSIDNPSRLGFISQFLLQHPAMGLYLYGELMISELPALQKLARSLYRQQIKVLDAEAKSVLRDMIF